MRSGDRSHRDVLSAVGNSSQALRDRWLQGSCPPGLVALKIIISCQQALAWQGGRGRDNNQGAGRWRAFPQQELSEPQSPAHRLQEDARRQSIQGHLKIPAIRSPRPAYPEAPTELCWPQRSRRSGGVAKAGPVPGKQWTPSFHVQPRKGSEHSLRGGIQAGK